jgi:hypothetical protein
MTEKQDSHLLLIFAGSSLLLSDACTISVMPNSNNSYGNSA